LTLLGSYYDPVAAAHAYDAAARTHGVLSLNFPPPRSRDCGDGDDDR
jgi:hypothetical protein